MAKEQGRKVVASNRKARHDYLIEDTFEAGIVLMGTEVKSLRMGRASLIDGYGTFRGDELWLEGVHIPEYVNGNWTNHTPRRRRKLLLHRAELAKIIRASRPRAATPSCRCSCTSRTAGPRSRSRSPRASGSTTSGTPCASARTPATPSGR